MKAADVCVAFTWALCGAISVSFSDGDFTEAAFMYGVGVLLGAFVGAWRVRSEVGK